MVVNSPVCRSQVSEDRKEECNMAEYKAEDDNRAEERETETGLVWKDRKHWMWFPFSFTTYRVENGRLYHKSGLFSTVENECLLYRITDISLKRTLGNKIFGTGSIYLTTRDASDRLLILKNVVNAQKVKDMLSHMVEEARIRTRSVGRELYGSAPGFPPHDGPDGDYEPDDFMPRD